jgi:hypothetical protein
MNLSFALHIVTSVIFRVVEYVDAAVAGQRHGRRESTTLDIHAAMYRFLCHPC